jgi:hypothetical protein
MFKAAQETHLTGLQCRIFAHLSQTEIRRLARITEKILDGCQSRGSRWLTYLFATRPRAQAASDPSRKRCVGQVTGIPFVMELVNIA